MKWDNVKGSNEIRYFQTPEKVETLLSRPIYRIKNGFVKWISSDELTEWSFSSKSKQPRREPGRIASAVPPHHLLHWQQVRKQQNKKGCLCLEWNTSGKHRKQLILLCYQALSNFKKIESDILRNSFKTEKMNTSTNQMGLSAVLKEPKGSF